MSRRTDRPNRFLGGALGALALAVLLAAPAGAEPWRDLTPAERELLQPYRQNWDRYPPEQQQRLRQGARRYLELSPAQRDAARRQQQRYRALTPQEQRALREEYRGRGRGRD